MESGRSVGTPGVLAALALVHEKYGKLPWAELFQPAIKLAREGFPVSPRLAKLLAEAAPETFAPQARAYFYRAPKASPGGRRHAHQPRACRHLRADRPWRPGRLLYEATSPATLPSPWRAIRAGRASSPEPISPPIAPIEREPICIAYRAYEVCGTGRPPPAAVTVAQVLGLARALRSRSDAACPHAHASDRRGRAPRLRRPRPLSRRQRFRERSGAGPARSGLSRPAPRPDRYRARAAEGRPGHPAQHPPRRLRPRRDNRERTARATSRSSTTTATRSP